jgi:hypothetical protein
MAKDKLKKGRVSVTSAVTMASETETCQLIGAGFEFVCDFGANKVFRKRK